METIIFEEHSSVVPEWKRRGVQGCTLIYLDAHIDLQFVSQKRIENLQHCATAEDLAKFEKPHHMLPDRGYSYSIEDFLYPAHRLGMISRLIWVNPCQKNQQKPQDLIGRLQGMQGVCLEDLTSFKQVGNIVEGKILGLDLVICNYQDLAQLQLPPNTAIDIDIDYFISLPQDEPWIDPKEVFASLQQLPVKPNFVTLTRSVSSGYTPLRYSFFADYLAALWQEDQPKSAHYTRLFELDSQLRQGEKEGAVEGCVDEIRQFPNCAATYYLLSLAEPQKERAENYRHLAANLDPAYRVNVLRSISELASRNLKFDRATLKELEHQLSLFDTSGQELAIAHFILALLYGKLGETREVFKHHQLYKQMLKRHPKLNFILGQMVLKAGFPQRAIRFLQSALVDDMTNCDAHRALGILYLKQGNLELAHDHLSKVCELMPAWNLPVSILATVYKKMGDSERHQATVHKYQQMQMATTLLTQKIEN